jgi:hypothetical protein
MLTFVFINLEEELEYQFPMIVFFRKWLPYDMLVFSNEKWDEVVNFNPMEKEMYGCFLMTEGKKIVINVD